MAIVKLFFLYNKIMRIDEHRLNALINSEACEVFNQLVGEEVRIRRAVLEQQDIPEHKQLRLLAEINALELARSLPLLELQKHTTNYN